MVQRRITKIEKWVDNLAVPHPRAIPQQPGRLAHHINRIAGSLAAFVVTLLIWMQAGIGLDLAIIASLVTLGFFNRFLKSPRRIKLATHGRQLVERFKSRPESVHINRRLRALLTIGAFLMLIGGWRGGEWLWYWGSLGVFNFLLGLLAVFQKMRRFREQT